MKEEVVVGGVREKDMLRKMEKFSYRQMDGVDSISIAVVCLPLTTWYRLCNKQNKH